MPAVAPYIIGGAHVTTQVDVCMLKGASGCVLGVVTGSYWLGMAPYGGWHSISRKLSQGMVISFGFEGCHVGNIVLIPKV